MRLTEPHAHAVPPRRRWRLLRRGVGYALATLLVLLALGNGIGSQLLPLAERNPDRIAAWLSARVQRTVAFDDVETEWTRRGPLLRLDRLVFAQDTGSAIVGPVRADFFVGWGDDAGEIAGRLKQPLALWVLWPR